MSDAVARQVITSGLQMHLCLEKLLNLEWELVHPFPTSELSRSDIRDKANPAGHELVAHAIRNGVGFLEDVVPHACTYQSEN